MRLRARLLTAGVVLVAAAHEIGASTRAPTAKWVVRGGDSQGRGRRKGSGGDAARHFAGRIRGGAVVSDPYHARMQVMITRNMRKVLLEELDYLPEEVDDMDPQIAAVVIEKSLPRPRAGMPIVWRRSIRRKGSSSANPLERTFKAVQGGIQTALNAALSVVTLPLRAVDVAKNGGVKGKAVLVAVLAIAVAVLSSDSDLVSDATSGVGAFGTKINNKIQDILPNTRKQGKKGAKTPSKDVEKSRFSATKSAAGATGSRWVSKKKQISGALTQPGGGNTTNDGGRGRRKKPKTKGFRTQKASSATESDVNEEEEACPDVPVNPNSDGAVWFEDLPPVPPAPGTVGVLEEGEAGTLDENPRWGQRPLSEHIPSEDEMETWESNMEPSDTWLDRGINNIMGSLFGRGGNRDDT